MSDLKLNVEINRKYKMQNTEKFNMLSSNTIDVVGTSLIGYIEMSYSQLVEVFGEPTSAGDEYKTDAEWNLKINDDIITIYNWKNGVNYCGTDGIQTNKIILWNVGGQQKNAHNTLVQYLEAHFGIPADYIARMFGDPSASFLRALSLAPKEDTIKFEDFFDIKSKEHLEALRVANTTGHWPNGFIPNNVSVNALSINHAVYMVLSSLL